MPVYMKRFVFASLAYLAAGTLCGFLNAVPSMNYIAQFAHVHFNLLGFMSMMVFGVGYFILPRFNGADVAYPNWISAHFWLANFSLVGMVVSRALEVHDGGGGMFHGMFMTFALMQGASVFMFVINIWKTMSQAKPAPAAPQPAPANRISLPTAEDVKPVSVSANTRVSDLVDIHPPVKQILISAGLSSLALPGHIDKVRQMGVTLGMACRNHGLDLEGTIADISAELSSAGIPLANKNATINSEMLIGDVLKNYPETRQIFQRHFGSGCFDCPGQAFESVSMACKMHGINEQQFLRELAGAVA